LHTINHAKNPEIARNEPGEEEYHDESHEDSNCTNALIFKLGYIQNMYESEHMNDKNKETDSALNDKIDWNIRFNRAIM